MRQSVDNITPHKGDKKLFWGSSNWQPLCAPCHTKQEIEERRKQEIKAPSDKVKAPSYLPKDLKGSSKK